MPAGRPPKPTNLKVSQGTARADRVAGNEFKPDVINDENLKPPYPLVGKARQVWADHVKPLVNKKILTDADLYQLCAYATEMGRYIELQAELRKKGEGVVITGENKNGKSYTMQNPKFSAMNASLKNAREIAAQFGFTPASRTRITQVEGTQTSLFGEFFRASKAS